MLPVIAESKALLVKLTKQMSYQ